MTRRALPPTNASSAGTVTRIAIAYHGHFNLHYGQDEYTVRVDWQR